MVIPKEAIDDGVIRHNIWHTTKLGHSSAQYLHGLTHPLSVTETFEKQADDCGIHPKTRLNDKTKGGETELLAAHATEAADDDVVGVQVESYSYLIWGGTGTDHPVEEGDDERRG